MDRSAKIIMVVALMMIATGVFLAARTWINRKANWVLGGSSRPLSDDALRSNTGEIITGSGNIDGTKLGVPIYPGANQAQAGSLAFSGAGTERENISGAIFTTSDSFEKVVDFYKEKLGPTAKVLSYDAEGEKQAILDITSSDQRDNIGIRISRKDESHTTEISVVSSSARH